MGPEGWKWRPKRQWPEVLGAGGNRENKGTCQVKERVERNQEQRQQGGVRIERGGLLVVQGVGNGGKWGQL